MKQCYPNLTRPTTSLRGRRPLPLVPLLTYTKLGLRPHISYNYTESKSRLLRCHKLYTNNAPRPIRAPTDVLDQFTSVNIDLN